ncbi:aldo/keto reductase [Candidatus Poribacteria bacterium]|nr:aldo/keto reductase [Candidatus Poribacteria bacterium]
MKMQYRTLGRTNLKVSLVSLGSGGPSHLGQKTGLTEIESRKFVRHALDQGINLIDTAAAYRESEVILGRALEEVPRGQYYIATKSRPSYEGIFLTKYELQAQVEKSLQRLRVDEIDLFQFHGIRKSEYEYTIEHLLPVADQLKKEGKIRFIGITERFSDDGTHQMLQQALADDHFDTIMVGYNLLSQSATKTIFPLCQANNVGVLVMIAVRRALSCPERLENVIADLKKRDIISSTALPDQNPLDWLIDNQTNSIPAAAYKFAAQPNAVSTVITGTSNCQHLANNISAVVGPPLPEEKIKKLRQIFGHISEGLGD